MKPTHIINVNLLGITAVNHIYSSYDYEIKSDLYNHNNDQSIPVVYNFMYKYCKQLPSEKIVVTLSPDPAISGSTVSALSERYMYTVFNPDKQNIPKYLSNLKIIYLTSRAGVSRFTENDVSIKSCAKSIITNLLRENDVTYTKHELTLSSSQFILIGLNPDTIETVDEEELSSREITYFTLKNLRKKSIEKITHSINELISDSPVHVIFDMSVMSDEVAPCVTRFLENASKKRIDGLNLNELTSFLNILNKTNIVGIDITGYDLRTNDTEAMYRVTCEVAKVMLKNLLEIKEKKINIFNENSRFLIWRNVYQKSHDDIGWFILRGISLDLKESLLNKLIDTELIIVPFENDNGEPEDAYVSTTTINDQYKKSYYVAEEINDYALFPEEKVHMMFELINTNENSLLKD